MRKFTPLALLCGLCLAPLGCTDMEDVRDENAEAIATENDAAADGVITEEEADDIEDEREDAAEVNEDLREGDVMEGTGIPGGEFDGNDADGPGDTTMDEDENPVAEGES